jgi:hypothetical protein
VVVAICFALSAFLSPVISAVPSAATAGVLVVVGCMMASSLKEIEWGAHDAKPEDFAGMYGRINVRNFESFSRAELDLFVNAAQEHAVQMQVVEYAVEQDGVVVEADEVVGIWGIIDGYIEEAVGSKDNIDTDVLKKQFRELYDDASANLEVL